METDAPSSSSSPPTAAVAATGTEGIDFWIIYDVDKMVENGQKPYTEPAWIQKELGKEDRLWCKCQLDKYYYDASVKAITGRDDRRKFRITFAGLESRHDQTFDFRNAYDSFLQFNLQTARFVKAYNAKLLETHRQKASEGGANFVESYDKNGKAFMQEFDEKDRGIIAGGLRIRYPPRRSIAEFFDCFKKDRTAFLRVHPYSSDNFLTEFQDKISENEFHNQFFHDEAEIQDAIEYCARIKDDQGRDTVDLSYAFGIIHLCRYLSYLYQRLHGTALTEENKRIFYLIHELSQFIWASNDLFYGTNDYLFS